jgi:hypothetical protein
MKSGKAAGKMVTAGGVLKKEKACQVVVERL